MQLQVIKYRLRDAHARFYTKYRAKLTFVHINKTGGSSIETALGLPFQHRTALELLRAIGPRRWQSRFSFTFVRNPWDKVASHYHYRIKTNQTGLGERPIPFSEWVRLAYLEKAAPYYDQPKMFMPQIDWVADEQDRVLVEFVGRFESLERDFAALCARIGSSATLPHLKKSQSGDYRRHYDADTAEIVQRCFQKDLDAFGYTFDPREAVRT